MQPLDQHRLHWLHLREALVHESVPMARPKNQATQAGSRRIADCASYLEVIASWLPGWDAHARLDKKLVRARAQDEPVLYAHFLPGLDLLLCAIPGARAPYPPVAELRQRCIESVTHALEQPLHRLRDGGCWYEFNGLAILVFASVGRNRTLVDFGASQCVDTSPVLR